jgi:hypothetical protein
MFILNKKIFFFFKIIHCLKTEINFYINNVPSLFRCKQNGPLFYFNHFPTDDEFYQTLTKKNILCDLSLLSIDQRIMIELDRLELLCEILYKQDYINHFLFFSSKCSTDLCRRFLPSSAIIITEYNKGDINKDRIDLFVHRNNSIQSIIAQLIDNKVNRNLVFIEFNSSFFVFL